MSPFFIPGVHTSRLKHDSDGHLLRRDGHPETPKEGVAYPMSYFQTERDYLADFQLGWPGYSLLLVGVCFIAHAIIVRLRPLPKTQ